VNADERERERNRGANRVLERELRHLTSRGVRFEQIARELAPRGRWPAPWAFLATPAHARATTDELARERERPVASTIERSLRDQERRGVTARELWRWLLVATHLDDQIAVEMRVLAELREGQRLLSDPRAVGTPNRYGLARDRFRAALGTSRAGHDVANAAHGTPQCLHALGRAEWSYARTLSRDGAEGVERNATLKAARDAFEEILRVYPWRDANEPSGGFPTRTEAPHAHATIAFTMVNEADPENPTEYNAAVDRAKEELEKLRRDYPYFHLWGEDAITGFPPSYGPTDPGRDEVVWYLQQMLYLPVLVFGGFIHYAGQPTPAFPTSAIRRWMPEPAPVGRWLDVNTIPFSTDSYGLTVTQLAPRRGERMGERFLVAGAFPESAGIYDAVANRIWTMVGRRVHARTIGPRDLPLLDGRVLFVGGIDTSQCEVFEPSTEAFRLTAPMAEVRRAPQAALLKDGRVLVAGGSCRDYGCYQQGLAASAEVYDPATDSWIRVANKLDELSLNGPRPVVLDDGSVLLAAHGGDRVSRTLQLFLPDKDRFWPGLDPASTPQDVAPWPATPLGEMTESRGWPWAVKLKDGRVLIGNGVFCYASGRRDLSQSVEIYDPATRSFTSAGTTQARGAGRSATMLPDGRVLVTGAYNGQCLDDSDRTEDVAEIYDPATSRWEAVAPMPLPLYVHALVRLQRRP
jgi:hypothetical protein